MTDLVVVGMAYFEVFVPPHRPVAPGEELFVDGMQLALGGALNTASVAAALGLKVTLCVPMGHGIVDQAIELLAARLGITLVPIPTRDNPAISLVFSDASDRSFVSTADLAALASVERLPSAKWIHVPGLEEASRLAAPLALARLDGARISVSGSWSAAQLERLADVDGKKGDAPPWDLLILNEKEALAACGDVAKAPELLAGSARSVLVTLGPKGAFGVLDGAPLQALAVPVPVADPTGAGDAFCGGLIAALLQGATPEQALRHGSRSAACILGQTGGVVTDAAIMKDLKGNAWKS
jgi:sugar/nucleoside kinase (ribokinase family)